uniref:Putative ovule protein n=1 Tax=Solanum chacoense TaxID=4108 RepID=A0A0V0HCE9_SOLCH
MSSPPPQSPLPWQYGGYSSESDCPPSLKKQKVDEEDGESSDCESEQPLPYSLSDTSLPDWDLDEAIEDLYCPVGPGEKKADKAVWDRYFQQIRESEGFDIRDYPGFCRLATVHPNFLKGPANFEMLKGYAGEALGQYNEKNDTKYEVKDILKVNGSGCKDINFFITFTVTNGEKEYFQAKVVRHLDQSLDFPIVRPRVKEGRDIE